jgi:autotransporter-associated beta strand protein
MKMVLTTLTLGALAVVSTASMPFQQERSAEAVAPGAFHAVVLGAVNTIVTGDARFGAVRGSDNAPPSFTVSLGAYGQEGSILFTSWSPNRLESGRYRVTDQMDVEAIQALVLTGSAQRPTGSFRVHGGTLTITRSSEYRIDGSYDLDGEGFTADAPDQEGRTIHVTGSFTALAN